MPDPADISSQLVPQPANKGVVTVYRSKRELAAANFLGGICWGFGSVMGATIVVALVLILLKALGGIPFFGSFINDIARSVSTRH